jgi:hypothetical protein
MNFLRSIFVTTLLFVVLSFGADAIRAQDEPQQEPPSTDTKPKPAARSNPVPLTDSGTQNDENNPQDPNQLQPDTTPLTGIQNPTLGSRELRHSFWVPGFLYASQIQSRGLNGSSGWVVNNYLVGNLSLLKSWRRSQLIVNYSGGGFLTTDSSQGNGYYQTFAVSQSFEWDRWIVQILDDYSYLPQSSFGFGSGTDLGDAGVGSFGPTIPSLGGGFVPNQSIYSSIGPRTSNVGAAQVSYSITPRGSITASGSYGLLSFTDPGSIGSRTVTASLGYNYLLSRESTIGLLYRFSNFQYPGEPQAFGSNVVAVAYSRKLAGRLALLLNAGPQFVRFRVPVGGQSTNVGANVTAGITYAIKNGDLAGNYVHGLSGGSGLYTGSTIDQVTFSVSQKLGRSWTGHASVGFADNRTVGVTTPNSLPSSTKTLFLGGGANRPIGPNVNLDLAYSANITRTGQTTGSYPTTQYFTISLRWHARPFVLE